MTSLYDFSVSGVSFGTDEGIITADDYLGSGVVATDYSSEGITTQSDEGVSFLHSIDQSILGDDHTISFTVAPSSGTFAQSIPSNIAGWDGTAISPNGIQFDIGNYYRGQWGDVVDGFGEVDGLDLDLPWKHSDSTSSVELTYADGYVINIDMPQSEELFPEAMDEHTEHDQVHYTPTLHFNLTEPETGRSFGDAVSAVFTETFDVTEAVEANGEVRLYQDGYDIHVQDSTGDWHDVLGKKGNAPQKLIDKLFSNPQGWQLSSAEIVDGVNELLFVSSDGTKSKIYECDEDWDIVSKTKSNKGKKHRINEDEHQIDLNGDGEVEGSNSYDLGIFFAQADVDPATESISFVGSTSGASDAGSGKAVDANGRSRYKHFVSETLEDNILTVEKTVMPVKGKTFYESIKKAEKFLTSWDGTAIATNALQFDFGNFYNGQWGIGEVDGIDFDLPWDHADSTSTYTLTFEDGKTLDITHAQSGTSFTEDGLADWDELHFAPLFAFDLPADESDQSDPDGLKLGDAVSVTFKETYVLADMIESAGSVNAAVTLDGSSYVQDEDNVWHDITGAADELTNHLGVDGASSRSFGDWLLSGAETINGVNQLVYSSVTDVSNTISVVADDVWDVVDGSATTVLHSAEDAINSLESQFGIDFDGDSLVSGIASLF